jgi:hypothetical protein
MNTLLQFNGFLNTPSLFLSENCFLNYSFFHLSNANTSKAIAIEVKENLMLGKRAESFFKYYLINQTDYKILIENLQVFDHKITIGEIDFIIENTKTNEKSHVELTYKFYLFDPNKSSEEIEKWIGPNRNDSLIQKINKLSQKQFPLLYSEHIKEPLINSFKKEIKQQVCFLAQLFVPYNYKDYHFNNINTKSIIGYYFNYDTFLKSEMVKQEFYIPKKQDWLINPNNNETWHSFEEISTQLNDLIVKKKSPLVWIKDQNQQRKKIFITWW